MNSAREREHMGHGSVKFESFARGVVPLIEVVRSPERDAATLAAVSHAWEEMKRGNPRLFDGPLLSVLLDASILERAFSELAAHLQRTPDQAWIPMEGILRLLNVEPRS